MGLLRKAAALALGAFALAGDVSAQVLVPWNAFVSGSYNTGSNWQFGQVPSQNDIAYFGTMGVNVALTSPAAVGGIQFAAFASGSYTLSTTSGATLFMGPYGVENYAPGNQQVGVPLVFNSARTPVTNQGTGTLTLGGSATSPTSIAINSGASILFGGAAASSGVVMGKLTGAGSVIFSGSNWTLWQKNDYTGGTTITDGRVTLNTGAALPASGALSIVAAAGRTATLDVNVGFSGTNPSLPNTVTLGALRLGGADYSSKPVINIGSGQLVLAGDVTYESVNNPSQASITATGGVGSVFLSGTRTFLIQESLVAGVELLIDSRLDGGGLVKSGAGTLQISNPQNSYTGGTFVKGGTLAVAGANAIPAGTSLVVSSAGGDAKLSVANNASATLSSLTLGVQTGGVGARNFVEFGGSSAFLALTPGGTVTVYGSGSDVGARIGNPFVGTVPNGTLNFGSGGTATIDVRRNNPAASYALDLLITSALSGGGAVQKTGAGAMLLEGSGALLGGNLGVSQGTVLFGSVFSPAGANNAGGGVTVASGAVIGAGARVTAFATEVGLSKAVTLNSGAQLGSWDLDQGSRLNLTGSVTLQPAANSTVVTLGLGGDSGTVISGGFDASVPNVSLSLVNTLAARRGLLAVRSATGPGIGSITVDGAGLILSALPVNANATLNATAGGYVGVAPAVAKGPTPSVQAIVDRVGTNKSSFSGTFGFDSFAEATAPQVFSDSVNFANFGSGLTLGSATGAILTGTITPPGGEYAFGNGGGILVLRGGAALTDASEGGPRSLSVVSSAGLKDNALALVLQTANSFTGGVRVANSLLLLDAAGALPGGARPVSFEAGAYVGFTENAGMIGPGGFRSLLSQSNFSALSVSPNAVLGLDSSQFIAEKLANTESSPAASRYLADRLDFSQVGTVGLGTLTRATLLGTLVGPTTAGSRSLRLLGVEGGVLEVRSRLTDANASSLTVGGNSLINADGKVVLAAQNTYTGGTTLLSGTLVAASSQRISSGSVVSGPLGLGVVTVPAEAHSPALAAGAYASATLGNVFLLGSRLALGSADSSPNYAPSSLTLAGTIGNLPGTTSGGLDIYGDVTLRGTSTFSGGVNLYSGVISLGSSSGPSGGPLGSGVLKVSPASSVYSVGLAALGAQGIVNPVVFEGAGSARFSVHGTGSLTLSGAVSLNSPVEFYVGSQPFYITGPVSGPGSLSLGYGSSGALVLNPAGGANTYSGGTSNYSGRIIFGSAAAIPAGSMLAPGYDGYTGYATGYVQGASFQNDFLAKFDRVNTSGTIGMDTLINGKLALSATQGTPNLFPEQIDLSGFSSSVRLGSASTAVLSGSVKPFQNTYSFGGGGGWLELTSGLTEIVAFGGTSLSVSSPPSSSNALPLTLRLNSSANTFTGGGDVSGSALIFGPGTMPPSGTFTVRNGGYIGTESLTDAFLGRLALGSSSVMVGFDTAPGGAVASITGGIDLGKLQNYSSVNDPQVLLGTASRAIIGGTITPRPGQALYAFGAYKGGQLTVTSRLASGSVQIGDSSNAAFHFNPNNPSEVSTVTLAAANSYDGGTSLVSGLLLLGDANALGTGPLAISKASAYSPLSPLLGSAVPDLSIANPVTLSGANLSLTGANSFTLTGAISGDGGVNKTGTGTVTLTGANSFTGVSIEQGTLVLGTASAAPLGYVSFAGSSGGTVRFLESSTVGHVYADSAAARIEVAAGKTFTVNLVSGASGNSTYVPVFSGEFAQTPGGGAFNLVFSGTVGSGASIPQLRLAGQSSYAGTTRIRSGIDLTVADNAAFGQSSVTLEGGRLSLASGVNLSNPLTLNSGTLAGEGQVTTSAIIAVGDGVKLQPGFELAGTLSFAAPTSADIALSLLGGGAYRWKIGDATAPGGEWDRVTVSGGVSIGATAASPFTVQMSPVGSPGLLSGGLAGFDPMQAYAWPILSASSISGFTTGAFMVDSSLFATLAPDYKFSVGLASDSLGSSLVLNYNPAAVPEPSTWVMLLSGAAAGALWLRRRRHG